MNKYFQYIKTNWLILGAVQWLWFKQKGPGILWLENHKVHFAYYKKNDEYMQALYDKYPIQTHIIVRFENHLILPFQLPKSPRECFEIVKPQFNDFIFNSSEGLSI